MRKGIAISSFVFGFLSIIPLFNYITSPLSLYLGVKSLIKIKKEPDKYGGKSFAIAGILISSIVIILTQIGIGMCLSGYKDICKNMGLSFLAS